MSPINYKKMLAHRLDQDFSKWTAHDHIQEREVHRFLHTMKGTAGTIGMMELSQFCDTQLDFFPEDSKTLLPVDSLKTFMAAFEPFFTSEKPVSSLIDLNPNVSAKKSFVLIIDADAEFAATVKDALEAQGIPVVISLEGKKGMEFFYTLQPQMVIVDLHLPDVPGFDLVARISETAKNRYLPIAVISADDRIENQIRTMEIGATDFLAKPLTMSLFVPYVINRLRNQEAISQGTLYDELTGAGNRKYFNNVLAQMTTLTERTRKPFTLVLLDLDHFKQVNDKYGHSGGDEVLKTFSKLLLKMKRESDYFFRYGGEEFALILPYTKANDALVLVERIRSVLMETAFSIESFEPFHITFSAGINEYHFKQDALVSKADHALYQAKKNGRNQSIIYTQVNGDLRRRLNIIIVDDDSLVRKLVAKQFSNWKPDDFDVYIEEYTDGANFVESNWYQSEANYMILLDGVMPKMDGLEVLNHVRNNFPHENIVISMLTSRNNESDIVLALKSGADDYIVKPFYAQEIVARVQRLTMRMFN